jgi:hypothetical protein
MIRDTFGSKIIAWVLKSNKDGWVLTQRGNKYSLDQLSQDAESEKLKIVNDETETEEVIEDRLGKMHNFAGVPLGLRNETHRPVVDVESAETAQAAGEMVTDGGEVHADQMLSIADMQNHLLIGSMTTASGNMIRYINPFIDRAEHDIVDLRDTMSLFRHAADPQTPVKAAKNAVEAERAVSGFDLGQYAQIAGLFGAFLLGAITVEFIAGADSGSGGIDVGLQIASVLMSVPLF